MPPNKRSRFLANTVASHISSSKSNPTNHRYNRLQSNCSMSMRPLSSPSLPRQLEQCVLYLLPDCFIAGGDSFDVSCGHRKNLFCAIHLEAQTVVIMAHVVKYESFDRGENFATQNRQEEVGGAVYLRLVHFYFPFYFA